MEKRQRKVGETPARRAMSKPKAAGGRTDDGEANDAAKPGRRSGNTSGERSEIEAAEKPASADDAVLEEWARQADDSARIGALSLQLFCVVQAAFAGGAPIRSLADEIGRNRETGRRTWKNLRKDMAAGWVTPRSQTRPEGQAPAAPEPGRGAEYGGDWS